MKTVWLLISPVLLLMNSAVTNSGAAYVMSLSLHSASGALTSSKRGSVKLRDIEPEKSSIGDSSSSTSSRPLLGSTSPRALAISRHRGAPISQSKESVCTSSRPGTSSGSRSLAKEIRFGAPGTEFEELVVDLLWLETAKMHSFRHLMRTAGDRRSPGLLAAHLRFSAGHALPGSARAHDT